MKTLNSPTSNFRKLHPRTLKAGCSVRKGGRRFELLQQVDIWAPHLIEVEERAKQHSQYLLFVIEPTAVNAASFIEIPYMLARA